LIIQCIGRFIKIVNLILCLPVSGEECAVNTFENSAMRGIFEPRTEKVTEARRKL
jgi:hypothetical protein